MSIPCAFWLFSLFCMAPGSPSESFRGVCEAPRNLSRFAQASVRLLGVVKAESVLEERGARGGFVVG